MTRNNISPILYFKDLLEFLLWFPPPLKLTATIYYSWNIVECGVKNHKPNQA